MISPATSQGDDCKGAWRLPSAEDFNVVSQLGIVSFGKSGRAKIKRALQGRHQLLFAVRLFQFLSLRRGRVAGLGTQVIVGIDDMQYQVRESHLFRRGLVAELVSRHGLDSSHNVLVLAWKYLSHHAGDRAFRLTEGEDAQEYDNKKNSTAAFHGSPPQCATSINR